MSSTDYGFDGLDEYAEMFERAAREWPKEFERIVLDIAHELQGRLSSDLTPKDTGKRAAAGRWAISSVRAASTSLRYTPTSSMPTRSTTATARRRVDMSQART